MSEENQSINKESSGPIKRDTKLIDLVKNYPDAASIVAGYGLHCIGCAAAQFETIEMGCGAHGMPDDVIDQMLEEINECVLDLEAKKNKNND